MNYRKIPQKRLFLKFDINLILLTFIGILSFSIFCVNISAQGDLIVFPKRVIFKGNQRLHTLNLANTGIDTSKYSISFVQIRMKEDGEFENISEPDSGQRFADPYLRIFPRTVTLPPKETQLMKIQLRNTGKLTKGEYRSHIYVRGVKPKKPSAFNRKESVEDSNSIAISLVPVYGITLPVIIQVGESTTKVKLSNQSFEMINDSIPTVKFVINREGNMSTYGDIKFEHISDEGKITQVGYIQGIAVYTPNSLRRCIFQLNKTQNVNYATGKLRLTYSAKREDENAIAELLLR